MMFSTTYYPINVVNTGKLRHRLRKSRTANKIRLPAKLAAQSALSNSETFIEASYPDKYKFQGKYARLRAQLLLWPIGLGIPPPGPKAMLLLWPIGLGMPPPGPKAMLLLWPIGLGMPPPGPKAMLLLWPIGLGMPPPGPKAMLLLWPIGLGMPPPGPKVAPCVTTGKAAKDNRLATTAKRGRVEIFKRGSEAQAALH